MAEEESPVFHDILISTTAPLLDINEDSLPHPHAMETSVLPQNDILWPSFDAPWIHSIKDEEISPETISMDQFLSNSSFDFPQTTFSVASSSSPSVCVKPQVTIVSKFSHLVDCNYHHCLSLSFANPPEPVYHVRYLSEITNSPLNGNIVNTKKKSKKNISGRYLKGTHDRHVTVALPSIPSDYSNLFIRVTRLTTPHQGISFIHPYPLLFSPPKKKMHSDVIIEGPSIYYKLNKEEICSRSKRFPNIILTRLKQCHLKEMDSLHSFDDSTLTYPFIGKNAKSKIATYQLKQSQLDFRLVIRCNQTGEFLDSNIFCRSNALLEEEGTECKRGSLP